MSVKILTGDCRALLAELPAGSVRCCVTSPPYFGLRDYGHAGQMGMEATPGEYCEAMVAVFREVRRVLTGDGTLWLNIGDSYSGSGKGGNPADSQWKGFVGNTDREAAATKFAGDDRLYGLAPKNLIGVPWRLAFALQADGWYLRSDIIWAKPNPMPESVTDRPTKAHEYVFLLSKSARYFYDAAAIREPVAPSQEGRVRADPVGGASHEERGQHSAGGVYKSGNGTRRLGINAASPHLGSGVPWEDDGTGRNARSVWTINTTPYREAHFATFPPALPRRCILAGSATGDTILDPFGGAGTTGLVADRLGRNAVLIELNPKYAKLAEDRITNDAPLFAEVSNA